MENGTKSKVKSVTGNGTWDSPHGLLYKFDYVMDDNTELNAMHKQNKPFDVGDDVEYIITGTNEYGNRGKVSKPSDGNTSYSGGGKSKYKPRNESEIVAQFCLREANQYCIVNGFGTDENGDPHQEDKHKMAHMETVAKLFANSIMRITEHINTMKKNTVESKTTDNANG